MGIKCSSGAAFYRQDEQGSRRRGLGGGGSVYQWVEENRPKQLAQTC